MRPSNARVLLVMIACLVNLLGGCRNAPRNPTALTPVSSPVPTPPPTSTIPASPTIPPTRTPVIVTYTIQPGDTLSAIAARYGTTVEAILQANPGIAPTNLQLNQEVLIPQSNPE
jgi:LysM repeat protein